MASERPALNFFGRNGRAIVVELDRNLARIGHETRGSKRSRASGVGQDAKWVSGALPQERAQLIRHKDGNVELFHRRMATLIKKDADLQDYEGRF